MKLSEFFNFIFDSINENGRIKLIQNFILEIFEIENNYCKEDNFCNFKDKLLEIIENLKNLKKNNESKDYKELINEYFEKENENLNKNKFFKGEEFEKRNLTEIILPSDIFGFENINKILEKIKIIKIELISNTGLSFKKIFNIQEIKEKLEKGKIKIGEIIKEFKMNPLKIIFDKFQSIEELEYFFENKEAALLKYDNGKNFEKFAYNFGMTIDFQFLKRFKEIDYFDCFSFFDYSKLIHNINNINAEGLLNFYFRK